MSVVPGDRRFVVEDGGSQIQRALWLSAILLVVGGLATRRFAPEVAAAIGSRLNPWALSPVTVAEYSPQALAHEEAVSRILADFRIGLLPAPSGWPVSGHAADSGPAAGAVEAEVTTLAAFLASAPERVQVLRKLLQEIGRSPEEAERQKMLNRLGEEVRQFKGMAGRPEVLPTWQMACALEWLVKQLAEKAGRVSPSTLRTVANGVDVLGELCRPGLRADLCTNPSIRLLAVDDDPVTRHAISFALKKGIGQPDLAGDGPDALSLAAKQAYDVIFMDVQMPGIDGFEVCLKIHETERNRKTPVVFVTVHSDFNARAKSTLCGGSDLISKPFITAEIAVKALTLALRARLAQSESSAEQSGANMPAEAPSTPKASDEAQAEEATEAIEPGAGRNQHPSRNLRRQQLRVRRTHARERLEDACDKCPSVPRGVDNTEFPLESEKSGLATATAPAQLPSTSAAMTRTEPPPATGAPDPVHEFVGRAAENLGRICKLVQSASQVGEGSGRQAMLVDLYRHICTFGPIPDCASLQPASQVAAAIEALLKKLLENPNNASSSTLQTLGTAIELLGDLCVPGLRADLATVPPVRLLVVDDDPLARRAITGALQLKFGRPESATDGAAALELATEKSFDVIFLDVQMPGMDGFNACARIHETEANRHTPVVFVTSHIDEETRRVAEQSGGSDFISKPFLCSELALKAHTFMLRRRLRELETSRAGLAPTEQKAPVLTGTC